MKNKNGFTLIELLAVIAIIALISLIAIPNIVGLTDGIRKDNMLDDAKKLISMAKYQVNANYSIRISTGHTWDFDQLNINNDIEKDPDGGEYKKDESFVKYTNDGSTARYCIVLKGSKRHIGGESCNPLSDENCLSEGGITCIPDTELYSKTNVHDNVTSGDDN